MRNYFGKKQLIHSNYELRIMNYELIKSAPKKSQLLLNVNVFAVWARSATHIFVYNIHNVKACDLHLLACLSTRY